jgi:hypothetical protein
MRFTTGSPDLQREENNHPSRKVDSSISRPSTEEGEEHKPLARASSAAPKFRVANP